MFQPSHTHLILSKVEKLLAWDPSPWVVSHGKYWTQGYFIMADLLNWKESDISAVKVIGV